MLPKGVALCAICDERFIRNQGREEFRSYFPVRKITLCPDCYHDWRVDPEYEHLRPDVEPEERVAIDEKREFTGDDHVFY